MIDASGEARVAVLHNPDLERLKPVFLKIIRGLHWLDHRKRLNPKARLRVLYELYDPTAPDSHPEKLFQLARRWQTEPERHVGEWVDWFNAVVQGRPEFGLWVFRFHKGKVYVAACLPPLSDEPFKSVTRQRTKRRVSRKAQSAARRKARLPK